MSIIAYDTHEMKWFISPLLSLVPNPPLTVIFDTIAYVFGACHLVVWNFAFATNEERICWRCASTTPAFCV